MVKTLHVRIKDKHAAILNRMAIDVNMSWNFINELSHRSIVDRYTWMSGYDLQKYVTGASNAGLLITQASANTVCTVYAEKRRKAKKSKLAWRSSFGSRKSLGWIPFRAACIKYKDGHIRYAGHLFSIWDSYGLADYTFKSGNFSQDSRGRWYINIAVDVTEIPSAGKSTIGIDLGLKDFLTTSDGVKVKAEQIYRNAQASLATAQRANKKHRVRAIHAQIRARRQDMLHKLSTQLVSENGAIFVGNVSSSKLVKTKMAKSVLDAGWSKFKRMLEYKAIGRQVFYQEVNEAWSTQTCSACGCIAGPKGLAGLNKRMWQCECGATHDRDVNSAINIRETGLRLLAGGSQSIGSNQMTIDANQIGELL